MKRIATGLTIIVLSAHIAFLIMEMFFWNSPYVMKTFGMTPEFALATKAMAANQGLYNGFLAAGLAWGLWKGKEGFAVTMFFLICALIAGAFGALTVKTSILFVQALPAALAIVAMLISRDQNA